MMFVWFLRCTEGASRLLIVFLYCKRNCFMEQEASSGACYLKRSPGLTFHDRPWLRCRICPGSWENGGWKTAGLCFCPCQPRAGTQIPPRGVASCSFVSRLNESLMLSPLHIPQGRVCPLPGASLPTLTDPRIGNLTLEHR